MKSRSSLESVYQERKAIENSKDLKFYWRVLWDVIVSIVILIPLYVQWIVTYSLPRKKKSVKGKLALITGGGGGLGKAMALKLASLGCNIAIVDINKSAADQAVKEVLEYGVKVKGYQVDVTKADQIIQLRSDIENDFGDIDILINNAGIVALTNLEEEPEYLETIVKVNLLSVILMTKYFLEKMKSQRSGHIVSISSLGGLHATPHFIPYCATNFRILNEFKSKDMIF